MLSEQQRQAAEFVGRAIAHTVIQEHIADRQWTGLDGDDGDRFAAVGLVPHTDEWDEAERVARLAYEVELTR